MKMHIYSETFHEHDIIEDPDIIPGIGERIVLQSNSIIGNNEVVNVIHFYTTVDYADHTIHAGDVIVIVK